MKRLCSTLLAVVLAGAGLLTLTATPAAAVCAPSVSNMSPTVGFTGGGTTVTLTGLCFTSAGAITSVTFGATVGTILGGTTDTTLKVTSPPEAAGAVTVTVHGPGADSVSAGTFTYYAPPTITSILPTQGPQGGGASVTVTGNNFVSGSSTASVAFGATAATSVSGVTNTSLTAVSPAESPGTVQLKVTVTLSSGEAALSNGEPFVVVPAPVVTSVSPTSGSPTGGTDVTITGANFQAGANVFFGPFDGTATSCPDPSTRAPLCSDASAVPVDVINSTTILVTTRAGIPGATNVVVVNPDSQHGALTSGTAGHYSFSGAGPAITTVAPATGSSLGGTPVTINGSGFIAGASVTFATSGDLHPANATAAVVNGAGTQITATTSAHAAGLVNVIVVNLGGGTATSTGAFTYSAAAAPAITGTLSPTTGTSLGGTHVTISGTGFASGAQVTFGGNPSPAAAVLNSMSISAVTPGHAGGAPVTVVVTNPDGQTATKTNAFTFITAAAPHITTVSPNSGDGGQSVTITGSGFANTNGASTNAVAPAVVAVGNAANCVPGVPGGTNTTTCLVAPTVPPMVVNTTTINGFVPNAPGGPATVVTVTNPDGQTVTSPFTYTGPSGTITLASISASTGPTLGNTTVTLTGTNFVKGAVVSFGPEQLVGGPLPGSTKAQSTTVGSDTSITAVTPAGVYGLVDVTVTNPGGGAAVLKNAFTFTTSPQPSITSISPNSGPGGTPVTITGTGFANTNGGSTNATTAALVTIGGSPIVPPASPPTVTSATSISGKVPTLPGGAYDTAVMNPDGQGAIASADYTVPSDVTAPTTTATGAVSGGGAYTFGSWATGHVKVTLTATDNSGGSGVQNITYSSTGATTISSTTVPGSTTQINFNNEGTSTLTYFATDLAGNIESSHTVTIMVDTVLPAIVTTASNTSGPYTAGTNSSSNVMVTFTCTDATSGVSSLIDTTVSANTTSGTNPLAVTLTSNGTGQSVTGTCTDNAGNVNTSTFSNINITKTAPTITTSATAGGAAYTAGVWTNEAVTVTFSCTPLTVSNQVATLTPPVQVSGPTTNQTVSGTCTDTAGNSSTITFGTPSAGIDIDLTLPLATATAKNADGSTYTANTWTDQSVIVTFHCTDSGSNQSGVNTLTPPVTVSAEGDTAGEVGGCTDVAGNAANPPAFFGPILIDKTAPVCGVTVTPNPIHPATRALTKVHATVTVTDASSGPNGFKLLSITSNNPSTAASDITGFTLGTASVNGKLRATLGRIYTFTYQGFDIAGNASALCTTQVKVTLTG